MICQKIDCGAEALGYLAQTKIETVSKAGTYSFGSWPEGDYQVDYLGGAVNDSIFGWIALCQNYWP